MSEENNSEHHTTPPGPTAVRQFGPERAENKQLGDTDFIDRQFNKWSSHLAYTQRSDFVDRLLSELSADPEKRPGISEDAQANEARLASIANDPRYNADSLKKMIPTKKYLRPLESTWKIAHKNLRLLKNWNAFTSIVRQT